MRDSRSIRRLTQLIHLFLEQRVTRSAAELAYFLTLSFFPFLICLNGVIGLLHADISNLLLLLDRFIPREMLRILGDYLHDVARADSRTILAAGLFVMVSSSSAAFRSLLDTLDDLYGRRHRRGLRGLLVGWLCSILLLLCVCLGVAVMLLGDRFADRLGRALRLPPFAIHWQQIRFSLLFAFLLVMVYTLYRLVDSRERLPDRSPVWLGALLAVIAMVAVSALFSRFIALSSRYALIYGSLASMIILMTWLYLCGNLLILGALFNVVRSRIH